MTVLRAGFDPAGPSPVSDSSSKSAPSTVGGRLLGEAGRSASPSYLRVRYLELRELRSWYRANRWLGWTDWEAETREQLRRVVLMRWGTRLALRADRAPGEMTMEYGR